MCLTSWLLLFGTPGAASLQPRTACPAMVPAVHCMAANTMLSLSLCSNVGRGGPHTPRIHRVDEVTGGV